MKDLRTFHRKFMQDCQNVYEPAEDSELLLEAAIREVREHDEVLEVGTGSGFVAFNLLGKCRLVIATDISRDAVMCAKSLGVETIQTDLAKGIKAKFSLILFNPPYLELEEKEKKGEWIEKAIDGGKDGIEISSRFLREIRENLAENGRIILISTSLNFEKLKESIKGYGYSWEIIGRKRVFFEEILALKLSKAD